MPHKIMKATLPTLTLGAMVGVAQADVLDDAINHAKDAGFTTNVQTRTEKVSSQSEADRLNQEETLRVQALAKRIQNQVQSAQSSDRSVQTVVTSVLTDQEKDSTQGLGPNQTITKENHDSQKAYENAVQSVEAKNAQARATYEAEKARIAQENAKALADYEAEKARVATQNAENQKTYEEAIKRIASENQQAKNAYELAKQKSEAELHAKEWLDAKVVEDAKAAGVTVRPTKTVDKGTVKESDLASLQREYDKAIDDVRAKLEVAKKELNKANVEFKANNQLKQFVKDQQAAIKAIIDKDNANTATTHIRTVIKQGPVIENADELKKAYQDLLQTAKDNAVRDRDAQKAYYLSQGKTDDEAYELARKAVAPHFLVRLQGLNPEYKEALLGGKPKITEVPVTVTLPEVPVGLDLTKTDDPKVVAYKKAVSDIEAELYKVWNSNEAVAMINSSNGPNQDGSSFSDNYDEDMKKYQAAQNELASLRTGVPGSNHLLSTVIDYYNDIIKSQASTLIDMAIDNATGGGSNRSFLNESNIEITKSSDSVKFLAKPADTGGSIFDVRTSTATVDSPEYFQIKEGLSADGAMVDATLVRIPKGQSITVKYTLKNGQPYIKGKQPKDMGSSVAQFFAQDTVAQYRKENKQLHDDDIQDVYTIEVKITNNGGVHDGDAIVAVRNNTWSPFYIGVANGTRPSDRIQWKLNSDEPSLAFSYRQDLSFRNQKNQLLALGLPQGEVTQEEHTYHGFQMGVTSRIRSDTHYVAKLFNPLDKAYPVERVDTTDITIKDGNDPSSEPNWGGYRNMYDSAGNELFTPPTGWEDKYMWTSVTSGMSDETTFSSVHKTYNKPLLDWGARNDKHNWSSLHETGTFTASANLSISGIQEYDITLTPRPVKPPTEVKVPKLTVDLVREVTLPRPKSTDPVDPVTIASIEPVKWVAKYTKPYTEKPPVPKEAPVQPPVLPEPKKPEEKPLPTPPKKEELPKRPELKAIASGSNSFVVKSRKATRPNISVERIQYVAEGRVSSANSLVVRTKNEVKRAGSGNSFIIRRM